MDAKIVGMVFCRTRQKCLAFLAFVAFLAVRCSRYSDLARRNPTASSRPPMCGVGALSRLPRLLGYNRFDV